MDLGPENSRQEVAAMALFLAADTGARITGQSLSISTVERGAYPVRASESVGSGDDVQLSWGS
jgi:hypothetical protein